MASRATYGIAEQLSMSLYVGKCSRWATGEDQASRCCHDHVLGSWGYAVSCRSRLGISCWLHQCLRIRTGNCILLIGPLSGSSELSRWVLRARVAGASQASLISGVSADLSFHPSFLRLLVLNCRMTSPDLPYMTAEAAVDGAIAKEDSVLDTSLELDQELFECVHRLVASCPDFDFA